MARSTEPGSAEIYQTAEIFRDKCLMSDGSLLFEGRTVWSPENVDYFFRAFVENPDLTPDKSFMTKLEEQLLGQNDDVIILAAEMLAIYFLFPETYSVKSKTKKENLNNVLEWAGLVLPVDHVITKAFNAGLAKTGTYYNTGRPDEITFFARFAKAWKALPAAQQTERISDPWLFQDFVDQIDTAKKRPLRHVLLHLLFPDTFERISGGSARKDIIKAFSSLAPEAEETDNDDKKLLAIRNAIQAEHPQFEHFFQSPWAEQWKTHAPNKKAKTPPSAKPESEKAISNSKSKNVILYGPPGTGKTHALISGKIPGLEFIKDLPPEQQRFVTFHPSFSYEDFIEGITPVLKDDSDGTLKYERKNGVLKQLAQLAQSDSIAIDSNIDLSKVNKWKMSLGNTKTADGDLVFEACIEKSLLLFGFVGEDLSKSISSTESLRDRLNELKVDNQSIATMMRQFTIEMRKGDIVLVTKGNSGGIRAIGEVQGQYEYKPELADEFGFNSDYTHARKVNWLWVNDERTIPSEKILNKQVSQRTLYSINSILKNEELIRILNSKTRGKDKDYVLKIDEINRGNVAKIFGEFITAIEEDKRETPITLASGKTLMIPQNLFIVGTMNTADRSLTHLDTALRRRFKFIELLPNPSLLNGKTIEGVNLTTLLTKMNERIESLLGREHTLGHGYFMKGVNKTIDTSQELYDVIMEKVLPQLQEYFFDDYEQIQMILGKEIINEAELKSLPDNFTTRKVYRINRLEISSFIRALQNEYDLKVEQGDA
ncbi:AAA family ATPase [Pseudodesulfovibrio sp. zrk46]|uniref:AAA family ATPase n=1 Tax=Pseudodesulfovibrio sp. zrk46 TaxID=2725288 RepID=UPI001449220C|nr:AAA family ATPase [Pseudodesulfovibrio sp. zrk46]QJB56558.1 AAA domain-containing protein [Pseudodesulfovibrio sp. zrk46]